MSRLHLGIILLMVAAVLAIGGPVLEARQRAPEAVARAYLRAVEQDDLDAALAAIDPTQRERLREQVAWQLRNRYGIVTLVLGRPSAVDWLTGRETRQAWVTVMADITPLAGDIWRSSSTVPLVRHEGNWYLARPLFA